MPSFGAGAKKKLLVTGGIGIAQRVELQPHVGDAKVGVGIEAFDEFFALMKHVAFDVIADAIPGELVVGLDEIGTGAAFDGVEVHEGLVTDHAGEGQPVFGGGAVIVIATVEMGVVLDGEHLLKQSEAGEHGGAGTSGDGDDDFDSVRVEGGEVDGEQTAHGRTNDSVEAVDTELIQHFELGAHHVVGGDGRKAGAVGFAGAWIDGSRAGGAVAAAEVVGAENEILIGIENFAGADVEVPPAALAVFRPAVSSVGFVGDDARRVLAAGKGVEEQDGIVPAGVEGAIGFEGDAGVGEDCATGQGEGGVRGADNAGSGLEFFGGSGDGHSI